MPAYPTLTNNFDIRSVLNPIPLNTILRYGDGIKSVIPKGTESLEKRYKVVQKVISLTEADTLRTFLETNSRGQSITVPLYNEDPTGATTGEFFIVSWSDNWSDTQVLPTFQIAFEEF